MSMFRCGGGEDADFLQLITCQESRNPGTYTIAETIRKGKKLLIFTRGTNTVVSSMSLSINFPSSDVDVIKEVTSADNIIKYAIIRPKTTTLNGSVTIGSNNSQAYNSFYILEIPETFQGIILTTPSGVASKTWDLTVIGTPPYRVITNIANTVGQGINDVQVRGIVQRNQISILKFQEISAKTGSLTCNWGNINQSSELLIY